jgi:hypothetical protein
VGRGVQQDQAGRALARKVPVRGARSRTRSSRPTRR